MTRRSAFAAVALAAIAALGSQTAALAGPKSSETAPTISLKGGEPVLGASVSFSTTYSNVKYPAVEVNCYQNGALVWGQVGLPTDIFKLGGDSSPWLSNGGGPASCVGELLSETWRGTTEEAMTVLATTPFAVSG